MSGDDREQQTEEASSHKLDKMREEGKVAKSADVATAAGLVAFTAALGAVGSSVASHHAQFAVRIFRLQDAGGPMRALEALVPLLAESLAPPIALVATAGVAAGVVQTGGLFAPHLLAPDLGRIDPSANMGNVLPSGKTLKEIGKQLLKVAMLGVVVHHVVSGFVPAFSVLAASSPAAVGRTVAVAVLGLLVQTSVAFVGVAALDAWWVRRQFAEDAKMSKQDLRDEHKELEGRPEIKHRQRARMREVIRSRSSAGGLATATVLLTNPTHFAVALRYRPKKDAAPILVAKASDERSFAMRAEARRHGVPIVENKPLARALHAEGKVGKPIPVEHYRAVAEVIAHVLRIGGNRA